MKNVVRLNIEQGDIFGNLTIIKELDRKIYPSGQTQRYFNCICICGKETNITLGHIKSGTVKSCGCLNNQPAVNRKQLEVGQKIGIGFLFKKDIGTIKDKRRIIVECLSCSKEKETTLYVAERSKSCGCLQSSKKDKYTANRVRIVSINRRGRKKLTDDKTITKEAIERIFYIQSGVCPVCLEKLENYHIDHIIPLSKGGEHSIYNIQLLCGACNLSKSDK